MIRLAGMRLAVMGESDGSLVHRLSGQLKEAHGQDIHILQGMNGKRAPREGIRALIEPKRGTGRLLEGINGGWDRLFTGIRPILHPPAGA